MFFLVVLILENLSYGQCTNFSASECVSNATSHRNCLLTEIGTCNTTCANPNLYEATGDNKKCIIKSCTSYNTETCYLNDACVLTEVTPEKCAASCVNYKIYLPTTENGTRKCTESVCEVRKPRSLTVQVKVTNVKFSYQNKYSNNVGISVMGIQQNTSLYNTQRNSTATDFNYTNEEFTWEHVNDEGLIDVRIQIYTEQKYFIGQAHINISDYKTSDGAKTALVVVAGNVTIPDQTQNVSLEIGVCTHCQSYIWPCGTPEEEIPCYLWHKNCSSTCAAGFEGDEQTGICERDEDDDDSGKRSKSLPRNALIGIIIGGVFGLLLLIILIVIIIVCAIKKRKKKDYQAVPDEKKSIALDGE